MSATNVACAGKRGNICVGNNVSSFARALIDTIECNFVSQYNAAKNCFSKFLKEIRSETHACAD